MKRVFLIIIAVVSAVHLQAQNISLQKRHFMDSVGQVLETTRQDSTKIQAALTLSSAYMQTNQIDSALTLARKALGMAETEGNASRKYAAYSQMGQLQLRLSDYPQALINFQNALLVAESLQNPSAKTTALQYIGKVYENQSQVEKALEYYQKGYEIEKDRENNLNTLTFVLSNIANAYTYLQQFDLALQYQLEALELRKNAEIVNPLNLGYSYNDIAFIYSSTGDLETALDSYRKAYAIFKPNNLYYETSIISSNMSGLFAQVNQMDSALIYSKEALQAAKAINAKRAISVAAAQLAQIYANQQDYLNAYENLTISMNYRDSVFNDERAIELGRLESRLELEQKEADNQKQQLIIEQQRKTNIAIGIGLVIVIVFAALLFHNRRKIQQANNMLQLRNREINQQKEEILATSESLKAAYKEISQQKEEISSQSEILQQTNEEVQAKNEELNERNLQIEEKNKKIVASINYASRIQSALLPMQERIRKILPEHFILLKPRDIVSGDFYWFEYKNDKAIIAAVDCTGHGVPGAFMSMLGHGALDDAILRQNLMEPDEILAYLDKNIQEMLKQEATDNKDGMDMAICVVDQKAKKLAYAGAKRPLIYFQNNEIQLIKGSRNSIGGYSVTGGEKKFHKHEIDIANTTQFYLFSDGFPDQFGGDQGKKYMVRRFKDKLSEIYQLPFAQQKKALEDALAAWMGDKYQQIDDILVIGGKVGGTS